MQINTDKQKIGLRPTPSSPQRIQGCVFTPIICRPRVAAGLGLQINTDKQKIGLTHGQQVKSSNDNVHQLLTRIYRLTVDHVECSLTANAVGFLRVVGVLIRLLLDQAETLLSLQGQRMMSSLSGAILVISTDGGLSCRVPIEQVTLLQQSPFPWPLSPRLLAVTVAAVTC